MNSTIDSVDTGHLFYDQVRLRFDSRVRQIQKFWQSFIACIATKKYGKTHHDQYLLAAKPTINEFFLFSNAFTTNKLRAKAACFSSFVGAAFALAVLSFLAFLHTAVGLTGLV